MLKDGGLIGGTLFDGNNATARSGGALFIPGWNALVQDSKVRSIQKLFTHRSVSTFDRVYFQLTTDELFFVWNGPKFVRNDAAIEAGAMFVYGRAVLFDNAFEENRARGPGAYGDVYMCSNASACVAYTPETRAFYGPTKGKGPYDDLDERPPVLEPNQARSVLRAFFDRKG